MNYMIGKCLYLKQRSKKGQIYYYCSKNREMVELSCFRECLDKEYKQVKKIKPVSKKRKTVSKKTYDEVFNRCNGRCALCGTARGLEYHHVYFRSERPDLIDDPDNGIMLCSEFENNCHKGKAHRRKLVYQPVLLDIIKAQKKS